MTRRSSTPPPVTNTPDSPAPRSPPGSADLQERGVPLPGHELARTLGGAVVVLEQTGELGGCPTYRVVGAVRALGDATHFTAGAQGGPGLRVFSPDQAHQGGSGQGREGRPTPASGGLPRRDPLLIAAGMAAVLLVLGLGPLALAALVSPRSCHPRESP